MPSKLPWFKFFPNDWLNDTNLQNCSLAAQGFMIKAVCILFGMENRGIFKSNGTAWADERICRRVGGDHTLALQCLVELLAEGALARSKDGAVYSRRMVRDEEKRKKCAIAGERGGGNPNLRPLKVSPMVKLKATPNVSPDSDSELLNAVSTTNNEKKNKGVQKSQEPEWTPEVIIGRIVARHPRRQGVTAGSSLLAAEIASSTDPKKFAEMVDESHQVLCNSEEWCKGFAPALMRWVAEKGYLDIKPEPEITQAAGVCLNCGEVNGHREWCASLLPELEDEVA